MVNYRDHTLDAVFAALAHPARRAMLEKLSHGESSVSELAEPFDMSLPAVSKHLRILEEAGLITREIDGRTHHLHMASQPMKAAADWLGKYHAFWDHKLTALEKFLLKKP